MAVVPRGAREGPAPQLAGRESHAVRDDAVPFSSLPASLSERGMPDKLHDR